MNREPPSRTTPLSSDEQELASRLEAGRSSEPSEALDRRIMEHARRPAPPRRNAWAGRRLGLGASAAAVLALAVFWPSPIPEDTTVHGDMSAVSRQPRTDAPGAVGEIQLQRTLQSRPVEAESAAVTGAGHDPAASAARAAMPASKADADADAHTDADATPSSPARGRAPMSMPAPQPVPQPHFQPVAADAELAPDAWIELIRARLAAGQREEPIESLALLLQTHPEQPVPADLRQLLE